MPAQDSVQIIHNFLRRIRYFWQNVFLSAVFVYGLSFYYRLQMHTVPITSPSLRIYNWISFMIALGLAIYIFQMKRKYFRAHYHEFILKKIFSADTQMREIELTRKFTTHIGSKMKQVWLLALLLILVGVIYYWLTKDAWNMHVYFIVGLYSLVINYPRKDLLNNVPYLIKEIFPDQPAQS